MMENILVQIHEAYYSLIYLQPYISITIIIFI
jgi:hypothetical protein